MSDKIDKIRLINPEDPICEKIFQNNQRTIKDEITDHKRMIARLEECITYNYRGWTMIRQNIQLDGSRKSELVMRLNHLHDNAYEINELLKIYKEELQILLKQPQ
jgi:hypothetical protein